jgi:riboflavin kinase
MIFGGIVQSGFGTGAYYVQLPHYFAAFSELLKAPPFPGTLNILLSEVNFAKLDSILQEKKPMVISGKNDANNGTWRIESYCSEVWNTTKEDRVRCLVLRFSRPDHPVETIELVSAHHLREKFDLEDGDTLQFHLV